MKRFDVTKATDSQLLTRFASGRDEAAFAEIVRRHRTMVAATARRLVHSPQDTEDVVQATFLAPTIDAIGDVIEVRAWKAGTEMPITPQFREHDDTYPTGGSVGVMLRNDFSKPGRGKSQAEFRFVHVAGTPIDDDTPQN